MTENNTFQQTYNLKITTLSPVHIGDTYSFEPTNYVICESLSDNNAQSTLICPECGCENSIEYVRKYHCCGECEEPLEIEGDSESSENYLYTFTPKQLSEALSVSDKNRLLDIVKRDIDLIRLQKFFKDNTKKIAAKGTKHALVCPACAKKYKEKFGNTDKQRGKENQFMIEKNICNPATDLAYIPATSLKGAIRTALMSKRNESYHLNVEKYKNDKGKYNGSKTEKDLYDYKEATSDPFKYLKLGDTTPENDYLTQICSAQNYAKMSSQTKKIPTDMEVIPHGVIFSSQLMIDSRFKQDIQSIRKACNDFYGKRLAADKEYMCKKHSIPEVFFNNIASAMQKPNVFLLRLGKHSGAESLTIEDMRKIWIHTKKYYADSSTSCWFAENGREKLPFGWCLVEFAPVK